MGRIGSSQLLHSPTESDPVRPEWTREVCKDLMECYNLSDPNKRGYMKRLYILWAEIRPEYRHLTAQNLRDQVASLKRRGFPQETESTSETSQDADIEAREALAIDEQLKKKFVEAFNEGKFTPRARNIHFKQHIPNKEITMINEIIDRLLSPAPSLETINCAVYAAATAVKRKEPINEKSNKLKARIIQLNNKILDCRKRASQFQSLLDYILNNRKFTIKIRRIANRIRQQHHTLNKHVLVLLKEQAVDKLRSLVAARKKVEKAKKRIEQNQKFKNKPSSFLAEHSGADLKPTIKEVEAYWRQLYESAPKINNQNEALKKFKTHCNKLIMDHGQYKEITPQEVLKAIATKPNFSAPGPDSINNYWWKKCVAVHKYLAKAFNDILEGKCEMPDWVCEGRTVLIYKKGDPSMPENYRPITCLNSMYKIFTSIMLERIMDTISPVWNNIYEQRGSKRGVAGVQENILIDSCVYKDAITYKRNISMGWIDYKKAFDSTSHELIITILRSMKIHPNIINTIQKIFPKWTTTVTAGVGRTKQTTSPIKIKRGVFQGDSLSPILFCASLLPLSLALRDCDGYAAGSPGHRQYKFTHIFYMDDLKLYAKGERELTEMIKLVQKYSTDIGMELGSNKCAICHLKRGRAAEGEPSMELVDGTSIKHIGVDDRYTYLGIPQRQMSDTANVKERLRVEYLQKLRKIWNSELSAANKCKATNTLAVSTISHTFGCIKWNVDELTDIDRKTRKLITKHRSLHPNASVQRLYMPRKDGGRGLVNVEELHNRLLITAACKIHKANAMPLSFVKAHELNGKGAFLFTAAERAAGLYGMWFSPVHQCPLTTLTTKELKAEIRKNSNKTFLEVHMGKAMHSQYYKSMEEQDLSRPLTFAFLTAPGLYSETEGYIIACQDGVFASLVYRKTILGAEIHDVRCRACRKDPETTMHLLSACSRYAPNLYITRHDMALKVLYFHLRHVYEIDKIKIPPFQGSEVLSIVENEKIKIFWNFPFATTAQIAANKPDMVVMLKETMSMLVIEMSCPAERNIASKEIEKRQKYKDLLLQLRLSYPEYKITFIPLIIGVLGGMKSSILDGLKHMNIKYVTGRSIAAQMQKYVILGSLRILRAHETSHPTT